MKENQETYQLFYGKAAAYCSLAEHCPSEVREKMRQWETPVECVEELIQQLIQDDFINECRYCKAFVSDKLKYNKWGCIKIAYELRRKGLPNPLVQDALQSIDEDEYFELALSLMEKKNKEVKAQDAYERKAKLFRFMAGRGFELELMERVYFKVMDA